MNVDVAKACILIIAAVSVTISLVTVIKGLLMIRKLEKQFKQNETSGETTPMKK